MSPTQITRSLFPNPGRRPSGRGRQGSILSHLLALGFALIPLAVVIHAWQLTA